MKNDFIDVRYRGDDAGANYCTIRLGPVSSAIVAALFIDCSIISAALWSLRTGLKRIEHAY